MLEQNLIEGAVAGAHLAHKPSPEGLPRLSAARCLAPLHQAIVSVHRGCYQGQDQMIIRFHNGYGAIISEHRLLEGVLEIAPVRFHGLRATDHEFHFRSHVPDLSWGSDCDEIVTVCRQIAGLRSSGTETLRCQT